jgi:DNA-binding winged helix-turn-helix (wHTH) protein
MAPRFGDFSLDRDTRQLLRGAEPLHVTPKAFELLQLLLDCRPKALSKDELLRRLWPDTFVAEANVPVLIREIRTALGDDAHAPRFVRTVHGYGYAFSGAVVEEPVQMPSGQPVGSSCWLLWETRRIPLAVGENRVGRDPAVAVWFDLPGVSRQHAVIIINEGEATLSDLGSKNGTSLRGQRLTAPARLRDGDEIRFGTVRMVFKISATMTTETVSMSATMPNADRSVDD